MVGRGAVGAVEWCVPRERRAQKAGDGVEGNVETPTVEERVEV